MFNTPNNTQSSNAIKKSEFFGRLHYLWLQHRAGVCLSVILALIYVLPLCLADQYFEDDTLRIMDGQKWPGLGRFWSDYLAELLSEQSAKIVNLFPFSLLLSAALLGFTGYLVSRILGLESKSRYCLSSIILITSPYFLNNLSYRYDLPSMALAIFLVLAPFCFYKKPIIFFITGVLGIFFSLGLYQAVAVIWVAMWLCLATRQFISGDWREVIQCTLLSAVIPVLGYILYRLCFYIFGINLPERSSSIFQDSDFYNILANRLDVYKYVLTKDFFASSYFYNLAIFGFITLIGVGCLIYKKRLYSRPITLLASLILLVLGTIFIVILTGLLNLTLEASWWAPRVMMSLPFLFYFLLVWQQSLTNWIIRLGIVCLSYYSFLLCTVYAEALKNRTEHENYLVNLIAPYTQKQDIRYIVIAGTQPKAPRNEIIEQNYPILRGLIAPNLSEDSFFNEYALLKYGPTSQILQLDDEGRRHAREGRCEASELAKFKDVTIRQENQTLIVDFLGEADCQK